MRTDTAALGPEEMDDVERFVGLGPRPGAIVAVVWATLLALAALLAVAAPSQADGFIVVDPPRDRPTLTWRDVPMTVKYHRVEVTIKDQVATTHVDQVFVNQASFTVEGTYIFPLPEDAAISSFDMTVDGNKYEGKILDRDEARSIYEGIVRQQRDPALLEYVGRGIFQAGVFSIPAGAERRIELTYVQVLQKDAGLVHYRYPLDIEKYSAQPIGEVQVKVRVENKSPSAQCIRPPTRCGWSATESVRPPQSTARPTSSPTAISTCTTACPRAARRSPSTCSAT